MKSLGRGMAVLVVVALSVCARSASAQSAELRSAHGWYLLASKANEYGAPMMARTYYTMAFAKHPHYSTIRTLAQRPPAEKTIDDTLFAEYCNALAWSIIADPTPDDEDYESAKALVVLGTQIGGVNYASADTIATAYALSKDYEEAYRWEMASAALYQIRKD